VDMEAQEDSWGVEAVVPALLLLRGDVGFLH
jgi:hypothetical protein